MTPADERLIRLLDARDTPRWLIGRLLNVSPARAEQLVEQVRASTPRGRVRRSVLLALAQQPNVLVLAVDPSTTEREALQLVTDAAVPGWTFRIDSTDDAIADAIRTARHRAAERGDDFEVYDRTRGIVHVRAMHGRARELRLFVVRRSGP